MDWHPRDGPPLVAELSQAERVILKSLQHHHFESEMKILSNLDGNEDQFEDCQKARNRNNTVKLSSNLHKLDPFVDKDGLLRVGGRLKSSASPFEIKHPGISNVMYHQFKIVVSLTENQRVKGSNAEQTNFRELLTHAHNGDLTESDWETLLSRTLKKVHNIGDFEKFSLRLCYHKRKVAEFNFEKLKHLNKSIAVIKARHSRGAHAISSDNTGGLEAVVYLTKGDKVILTMNLWTDVGLCNGSLGTVIDFIYSEGQQPPCLPISVLVQFDKEYKGPSISSRIPNLVPICPVTLH